MVKMRERNPTSAAHRVHWPRYIEARARNFSRAVWPAIPRSEVALTRGLSWVERATTRLVVPSPTETPGDFGLLPEAKVRLSIYKARGVIESMSAQEVAANLTSVFWPHPSKYASKGWWLLWQLDALDEIQAWVGTPDPGDARRFTLVRLRTRMAEMQNANSAHLQNARPERRQREPA